METTGVSSFRRAISSISFGSQKIEWGSFGSVVKANWNYQIVAVKLCKKNKPGIVQEIAALEKWR
jgi:hypothetical protein